MKAMIFAAGLGTRLKPLTDTMPKALVPLKGKTLLAWQIETLKAADIHDITINVHHFPDMIIDYVHQHEDFGCTIHISDERDQLLDTGGGLKKAFCSAAQVPDEPVLACNVDILSNIRVHDLMQTYARTQETQLVVSKRETQRYLCFDDKDYLCGWTNIATGEVKHQDGKHLAFSGMQILSPETLKRLQKMQMYKFSMVDFYLSICQEVPLHAYVPTDYKMMDVGKIAQIHEAEAFAESLLC